MTDRPPVLPSLTPHEMAVRDAEIIRLAQKEHLSHRVIAIKIGTSKGTVRRVLDLAGIKTVFWDDQQHGRRGQGRPTTDAVRKVERDKITLAPVPSLEREDP